MSSSIALIPKLKINLVSTLDDEMELPSTAGSGVKRFFQIPPDTPFKVKYSVEYPQNISPRYEKMFICLELNGESVGYGKQVQPNWKTGYFEGFFKPMTNKR
jgi:hypothetical protein